MRARGAIYALAIAAAAAIVLGPPTFTRLFPQHTRYASDAEHFKYGSVGVEAASGIPFEVWRTLPAICMAPEQRASGYRAFGFQWEPGRATPIGLPVERAIIPRVGVNCALCHVGRVDTEHGSPLILGAPNTTLDLQSYLRFLFRCASSPAFNADAILAENRRLGGRLNVLDRAFYRFVIIPQMRTALSKQQRQLAFMDQQPDWGPGRASGFQPAKVQILKQAFDGTLDIVDIPALWNMGSRDGQGLHWDGVNTSLHEVFLNSGIGNGATAKTIDVGSLDRMERWTAHLASLPYPFAIDADLAAAGRAVFTRGCSSCHAAAGPTLGEVIPIGIVGTDRSRLDAFTPDTLQMFQASRDYAWRYTHFRKTGGYVAVPLNGIWARAPYLHNGSVPTLAALLTLPAHRPVLFRRGSTAYDANSVGFRSDKGWLYDTRLPGNGNSGHLWGTELSTPEKQALLEYLKTL